MLVVLYDGRCCCKKLVEYDHFRAVPDAAAEDHIEMVVCIR